MHTNSTPNYNLPQFVSTDKPTWLGDVNGAMSAIDTAIAGVNSTAAGADSKADNAVTTANTAAGTASDAATLAETANTNATSALTTAGNAATAASAAQSTAEAASTAASAASTKADTADGKADANALKIGDLTTLTTTDKTDLVGAINEVNAKPSGGGTAADITYDNTTSGLTATNVQAAIDEIAAGLTPAGDLYSCTESTSGSASALAVSKNGVVVANLISSSPTLTYHDVLVLVHFDGGWKFDADTNCTADGVPYASGANIFTIGSFTSQTKTARVIATPAN